MPSTDSPTAVFFDLDGTVVEFTRSYGDVLVETFEAHTDDRPVELAEAYNEHFFARFDAVEPEPVLGAMRDAVAETGHDLDPEALRDTLHEKELDMTAVSDEARALFDELAERHHLGVLTNGVPEWQRSKLAHHGLTDRFETFVASYEAGAHKPDSAPYDLARERAPDEISRFVMVGDDYEPDVQGARDAGFEAIHLDRGVESVVVPDIESLGLLRDF
ncbi:HAD family hydrolase [Haloarchaeobius sp. DFWS5]|uniref:HAD family hydrolase n=1 Tax=Haloarchaeobius sp. DFWS5 TaxID=3446114 RepID=UPI003EBE26E5